VERGQGRVGGLFTWSAAETLWLARLGWDDLLLGYPVSRAPEARALAQAAALGRRISAVIDDLRQARALSAAVGDGPPIGLVIELDLSWQPTPELHLGALRSPLRDAEAVLELARRAAELPGLELRGLLGYEAQIAGVPDENPHSRARDPLRWLVKRQSSPLVLDRRRAAVETLLAAGLELQLVNGGGTGSLPFSARDPVLTEITAGSGLYCPTLFDHYRELPLRPALHFALPISRCPDGEHITCQGGGIIASGPAGADRQPTALLPRGLQPIDLEGWGEVMTPFLLSDLSQELIPGDPVLCRPAKAGEPLERFEELLIIEEGVMAERLPTYRGLGACFA
jgi:D-serine deaminase-like pyridoxal phosphate-dependent protein